MECYFLHSKKFLPNANDFLFSFHSLLKEKNIYFYFEAIKTWLEPLQTHRNALSDWLYSSFPHLKVHCFRKWKPTHKWIKNQVRIGQHQLWHHLFSLNTSGLISTETLFKKAMIDIEKCLQGKIKWKQW